MENLPATPSANDASFESLLPAVTCTLVRAGWWPRPAKWHPQTFAHANYVAFIAVGGAADYVIGGEPYHLAPGGVLVMPPNVRRQTQHYQDNPLRMYSVHFLARLYGVVDFLASCGMPVSLTPPPSLMAELVGTAQRIVQDLAECRPGWSLAAQGECARLVALLWRTAACQEDTPEGTSEGTRGDTWSAGTPNAPGVMGALDRAARLARLTRLEPVFRAIQARYAEPLTLDALAATIPLNATYFCELFKEATGLTPLRYVARFRMERVRQLLLSTDASIAQVAARTGFRDPFYLSRAFHRVEGMSPSEYRAAHLSLDAQ